MLSDIKVIIWDFDGTLYPQNAAVTQAMEEGQYQTIMRHTGWSRQRAKDEFWKVYPKETTSGNAAVGLICHIPTPQAAVENERGFDRRVFIQKSQELTTLFASLANFRHFILGNGVKENLVDTTKALGIHDRFEEIVTSETVGANKPDPAGFVYIMEKTGCTPAQHLMVGDREVVDLVPAKTLGMHTCLVAWGEGFAELPKTLGSADVSIPTPYDLPLVIST